MSTHSDISVWNDTSKLGQPTRNKNFFAHPAGFNGNMFKPFAEILDATTYSISFVGHGSYWHEYSKTAQFKSEDLMKQLKDSQLPDFEIASGVSMGGASILFGHEYVQAKKYYLFEPVLPFLENSIATGIHLHRLASNRRNSWPSLKAAKDHLSSKKTFSRFDKKIWGAFLDDAFVVEDDQTVLACDPKFESQLYKIQSDITKHDFEKMVKEVKNKAEVVLFYATEDSLYTPNDIDYLKSVEIETIKLPTGHFCICEDVNIFKDFNLI
jgi:hypothetical protein